MESHSHNQSAIMRQFSPHALGNEQNSDRKEKILMNPT